jgi:hypothetical protein
MTNDLPDAPVSPAIEVKAKTIWGRDEASKKEI